FDVYVDATAPDSSDDAPAGWVNGPVDVTLSRVDTLSGPADTYYVLNAGAPALYGAPVHVTLEGTNTLAYWSTDAVGNVEPTRTALVRIDDSAPVTTCTVQTSYTGTATITLVRSDAYSGAAHTYWSLDGAAAVEGTSVTTTLGGVHTLEFRSVDAIGNSETTKSVSFDVLQRFDHTDPAIFYDGSQWATSTNAAYHGGTIRYATTGNPRAVFMFRGTGFDWIAYRNTAYGIATITVDGSVVTTDLYSPTVVYKSIVYRTRSLADTTHTVVIERTGSKNASASAANVDIDAIDLVGQFVTDTFAPVTTHAAETEWSSTPVTVTLSASDTGVGVRNTYYRIGAGSQTTYTAPFSVSVPGTATVAYWSVDKRGNIESENSLETRYDSNAPTTTPEYPGGWVAGSATVTLTATDEHSGVASTYYRIGAGADTTYTAPFAITDEGTTTVAFWSTDAVGRVEAEQTLDVHVDASAPVTGDDAPTGWAKGPVAVHLTPTDAYSGIGTTYYTLNGGAPEVYGGQIDVTLEGTNTVVYWAVDNVGNTEATHSAGFRVDSTAPLTTSNALASYAESASISLTATDTGSAVAHTYWSLDGGTWTEGTTMTTSAGGTHQLRFYSVDSVGNVETTKTAVFDVLVRYDHTNSAIVYEGSSWATSSSGFHYGGSIRYANGLPAKATFMFDGTGFDWVAFRTTSYGIATVTVDGSS
ncbi:MAG: hypothetical protein FDZ70_09690, partial [Actinobacteria bacterium]